MVWVGVIKYSEKNGVDPANGLEGKDGYAMYWRVV